MRRKLTVVDRIVVKLEARVRDLERENAWLRSMSSSGFARGVIKPAPKSEWIVEPEPDDLI